MDRTVTTQITADHLLQIDGLLRRGYNLVTLSTAGKFRANFFSEAYHDNEGTVDFDSFEDAIQAAKSRVAAWEGRGK